MTRAPVAIVGAGLAGSEAALALGRRGIRCELYEMRPGTMTPAHRTGLPAELVCSNSLKSRSLVSAHGVLKQELRLLGSPLLALAEQCSVPAGSALAVDRGQFSAKVLEALEGAGTVRLVREECVEPPAGYECCIVAAGPLASPKLTAWLGRTFSSDSLFFYDAIAPIVAADSVDMRTAFVASRNEPGVPGDYVNCPFSEEQYRRFHEELVRADEVVAREFEDARFFEACLPVEVIARRGYLALAFGTLRPVGLTDPATGRRPFAVCQLRRETRSGESLSLVGFQTRVRIPEQRRVFRMIPGLERAEFLRYGSIHRNTYLDSPRLLNRDLSFRGRPELFVAGQLSGSEGYTESIATGSLAAAAVAARLRGEQFVPPPGSTLCGALLAYVCGAHDGVFCPSNANFGLLAPLEGRMHGRGAKRRKKESLAERSAAEMGRWVEETGVPGPSVRNRE